MRRTKRWIKLDVRRAVHSRRPHSLRDDSTRSDDNDITLLQVGYQRSPALFAELRPQLEEAVPPDKLPMMGNPWDAARDCSEEAWRSALDQGKPSDRHWILRAQAEGDAMMRSITEQLLGTNL